MKFGAYCLYPQAFHKPYQQPLTDYAICTSWHLAFSQRNDGYQ